LSGDHVGALEVLHFIYLSRGDKLQALTKIIEVENPESAILFCNTKVETERVAEALERQGFTAAWLNGDLPQGEREQVMSSTREGRLRFLVATDVAARGIDISHLTHVINYDFPDSTERYVHRTGRTGRAGRTGTAISIITPKDIGNLYLLRLTYKIRPIEKQLPTAGELRTRAEADLVQMLADAFLTAPAHPDDLALARRLFSHDSAEHIVAGLLRDHLGARPEAVEEAAAARRSKVVKSPTSEPDRAEPPRTAPSAVRQVDVREPTSSDAPERATVTPLRVDAAKDAEKGRDRGRSRKERPLRKAAENDEEALRITWVEEPQFAANDATFAEIFVNIGRQDGVTAADLQRVLTEFAEIARAETGRIRVRDRSSFVSVKKELLTKALTALNGRSFSGKVCQAEPARARSSGTSSTNDG
jgi:ATP-dependent RNA helicase DeaD